MECAWAALRIEREPEETAAMAAENWVGVYCFMWDVERGPGILAFVKGGCWGIDKVEGGIDGVEGGIVRGMVRKWTGRFGVSR